ncbi:prolipoprotein diacylglyceryl transferase [Persicobacter psychrovividus]|uniref:Diacylglyceryl transferase n=1 Tax=Persicobacter psychrovividus TaxID=387638 RepID=A0ABM7VJR1_9BACT|nr:hypothetical protein PEPS_33410 [Persicobacter psychrovividus]
MRLPFEYHILGWPLNIHLILEYLAFFIGFRYYRYLQRSAVDKISSYHRLVIILGAIIGAYFGSRFFGYLENPIVDFANTDLMTLLNTKTIMGGLFGGVIGVELAKYQIGEQHSSGDLFTLPIILGIFIGRIGCFLSGTHEFTYGTETDILFGMNLGDGLMRHPIMLYELCFLIVLFVWLHWRKERLARHQDGLLFALFMLAYFGFRFLMEFLKPNVFFVLGLSSIQWLCVLCWAYYFLTIKRRQYYAR